MRNIFVILFFCLSIGQGAYLENIPVTLHQPDDTELNCFSTGDEYYIRLHNEENYTIIQSQVDGYYYFAQFTNDRLFRLFSEQIMQFLPELILKKVFKLVKNPI